MSFRSFLGVRPLGAFRALTGGVLHETEACTPCKCNFNVENLRDISFIVIFAIAKNRLYDNNRRCREIFSSLS